MSALPKGWIEATIGEVADVQLGKMLDRVKNKGEPTPYLRNINVRWGEFELADIATMRFTADERAFFSIRDGDVLVCEGGEPGRAAVWRNGETNLVFQKALLRLRPGTGVMPEWLAYLLRLRAGNGELAPYFTGTTIKHLPATVLRKLSVPIPPAREQRRIMTKVDALKARLARARSEAMRTQEMAERARTAVLAAAFSGRLTARWRADRKLEPAWKLVARVPEPEQPRGGRDATESVVPGAYALSINNPSSTPPEGWTWVPLVRLARQESGHTPSRSHPEYWDGDIPWIGIRDANEAHGRVINDTLQKVSQLGLENSSARLLPAGTVCLSRTASVGYVTIMGRAMATSQDFVTWSCGPALLPEFLMYALMAEGDGIKQFGKGSTHTTIYFPEIRALNICLAPLEEQREIVSRVQSALVRIERAMAESRKASALLDRLEYAILSKAFSGKLVSQDARDEPASLLFERLKVELKEIPKVKRPSVSLIIESSSPMKSHPEDKILADSEEWPEHGLTFDQIRQRFPSDYEQLRDTIFSLLEGSRPALRQHFDRDEKVMKFRRVS